MTYANREKAISVSVTVFIIRRSESVMELAGDFILPDDTNSVFYRPDEPDSYDDNRASDSPRLRFWSLREV